MGGSESKDREENGENKEPSGAAMAAGVIASLAICAVGTGVASQMGNSSKFSGRKTMKAPGRDKRIFRDKFAKDPAAYFRDLRK